MTKWIKRLEWEVKIPWSDDRPVYYMGRGTTPQAAIQDLRNSIAKGVLDAKEKADIAATRLEVLTNYAAELPDG